MNTESNIFKWYPFETKSKIYELHSGESILEKMNLDVEITSCYIKNFKITGEYDYITVVGSYSDVLLVSNSYVDFLNELRQHLNEGGRILIAIDNRIGAKYLVGAKSEIYERVFYGLENGINNGKRNLLTKKEIIDQLNQANYMYYKFYYPLPDYKNTNVIYSDEFMPTVSHSKFLYAPSYDEGSIILYDEINLIKQMCEMDMFSCFTNSFFIEASDKPISNGIKFVSYNLYRKDAYKTMLTISGGNVQKVPENDLAKNHIENIGKNITRLKELGFNIVDEYSDGIIKSKFIEIEELDKVIVNMIQQGDIDQATQEIESWYLFITEKLGHNKSYDGNIFQQFMIDIPEKVQEKLLYTDDGFIDLSFENTFINNGYLFYDQEWYYKKVPLEFILYRAINNLYTYHLGNIQTKLNKSEVFKKFNLLEYIDYFDILEKKIQEKILDFDKVKEYSIAKYLYNIEALKNKHSIEEERLITCNEQFKNQIENLEDDNKKWAEMYAKLNKKTVTLKGQKDKIEQEHQKLLDEYNTSKGWKIIKGIRKIIGKD